MAGKYTEAWLDGPSGHRFYTCTYPAEPPKAVVIFVPGFADHISRYEGIHPKFAQHGFTVFAYDMRGFGRTALDAEHRSADEYYGKTNRLLEITDLEWWVEHVAREYPKVPIFLLGYSASPLYLLTYPPPTIVRYIVRAISKIAPACPLPAPMPAERFSRDPAVVEALKNDTLRMPRGTAQGLDNMIGQGEELLHEDYKYWPKDLPLLMTWGTADEVNCPKSGVEFYNKLDIEDKKLVEYEHALHDLLREVDGIPNKVLNEYFVWLESHAAARPSL
ncbi:hypothetical protein BN946_scf184722.g5 [Trametes cinnabarina]|uniref:Serine aminopeptidase S33 domain-containing protein n=1 Tax=Pycnoporus cinnabarinus TaxID=5643 RepID=A0A060SZ68_PYCCI|nr:hypothetical protein BN946_scf184722.g5 [Trametes cinnabarina]